MRARTRKLRLKLYFARCIRVCEGPTSSYARIIPHVARGLRRAKPSNPARIPRTRGHVRPHYLSLINADLVVSLTRATRMPPILNGFEYANSALILFLPPPTIVDRIEPRSDPHADRIISLEEEKRERHLFAS